MRRTMNKPKLTWKQAHVAIWWLTFPLQLFRNFVDFIFLVLAIIFTIPYDFCNNVIRNVESTIFWDLQGKSRYFDGENYTRKWTR